MTAYYNEHDPYAAQWLRNLIAAGLIAPGDVDERSIEDVRPDDLVGYRQCHFFAGLGGWSYALRLAGWPDDRPVWTGSCPCQPFSAAGKGLGFADERHLWPAWHWLIAQCRPERIYGEQVASKDGLAWLDLVCADLEAAGYAVGAVDLCAAGVGAPHIRQRLWFVADDTQHGRGQGGSFGGRCAPRSDADARAGLEHSCGSVIVADSSSTRLEGRARAGGADQRAVGSHGVAGGVAGADGWDASAERLQRSGQHRFFSSDGRGTHWSDADWLLCRDGKWRPVEPGASPLAHGVPARVGRLRAYGNAIVAQAAALVVWATDGRIA